MAKKSVALIGLSYNGWCPKVTEKWALNQSRLMTKENINLHFYLHAKESMPEFDNMTYMSNVTDTPVVVIKPFKDIGNNYVYPLQKISRKFGTDYFTSTIAFMIALALCKGFDEIHLIGLPLRTPVEYFEQKACIEYWIGRAEGMGVKVHIQDDASILLKQSDDILYGYELTYKQIVRKRIGR